MSAVVDRVLERRLSYLSQPRLALLIETVEQIRAAGVPGDLAEFGIALGGSAICIASALGAGQRFYGFDNFEMIPSPEPVDGEGPNTRYQVIKSGRSTGIGDDPYYGYVEDRLALVKGNFEEFGLSVDGERIVLVKGRFEEILPAALAGPIAFAHIDCDWYSPVKRCLESLYPRLNQGATICVDDYGHWDGCTKATDEFCEAHADITFAPGRGHALLTR